MRFPFRIALYVFDLLSPSIGPMGGWVRPEGFCWEFAPSGASAAEPSKWGTSYWLKKNGLRVQLLPQRGVVGASTGGASARGLCASASAMRGRRE